MKYKDKIWIGVSNESRKIAETFCEMERLPYSERVVLRDMMRSEGAAPYAGYSFKTTTYGCIVFKNGMFKVIPCANFIEPPQLGQILDAQSWSVC